MEHSYNRCGKEQQLVGAQGRGHWKKGKEGGRGRPRQRWHGAQHVAPDHRLHERRGTSAVV
ncbi:hypothetical protein E2562_018563 [Oryza meyeriana var. granulata]|uniref:Uncharacterized protein n=1 Tax=Oryza meyeriana var. granulata TaxID=110450 RepID=A0A6G1F959_9ORYZ|nr:hypothetical protein E2562_018563 [Oryza meyeriana var. granulata]